MEKALNAYTDEHIHQYFNDVRANGLTEHGFPRLTANIGILIAHGRRTDLLPIFLEMMEFCCKNIPTVRAANDFSVREIICCLWEIEQSGITSKEDTARWRSYLATIEPTTCYNRFAVTTADDVRNWALFTAVSEFFRQKAGIGYSSEFIDLQIASQLKFLDENGMYMDNEESEVHQPIMYDLVSRGLLSLLLHFGYQGRYYEQIDACLKKSALLTLKMQSPNGEMAFGGRSNQFLHNEAWMAVIFEYEADRYANEGNLELAKTFKSSITRAMNVTERWLSKKPVRHIKNRFPTETKYGCENYAYFDKYMITTASNLYAAYLLCDDSIPTAESSDRTPSVFQTTDHFHKLFLKSGGYGLEFDINADPHYDASGLGRVHRDGAPAPICLSVPCSADPLYILNLQEPISCSLCPAIRKNGEWHFATDTSVTYDVTELSCDEGSASATVLCRFSENECVISKYTVNADGVQIEVAGENEIAYMLPAFYFDGEEYTDITLNENCLTVSYNGWSCRYTTDGMISSLNKITGNRNGYYKIFLTDKEKSIRIKIEILK